ncbi:MAG: D-aminoacyl-tRNA deacylase, partial [Planctomycetota bacterium]
MRTVVQRVLEARVDVLGAGDRRTGGSIGPGLVALVGVAAGDTEADSDWT